MKKELGISHQSKPTVVGTGLVALDVVFGIELAQAPRFFVGGTCGNVLTILGAFGWESSPIARLMVDGASRLVRSDIERWGVSTELLRMQPRAPCPVIIQKISRAKEGDLRHSFSWYCPNCGARLPGYQAITIPMAKRALTQLPKNANVFFFDRVSRGALILANTLSSTGALVVFEPSSIGDPRLFAEALAISDVVKYSRERIRMDAASIDVMRRRDRPTLEIETLGHEGLRYRLVRGPWKTLPPAELRTFKDAAGAGDWCTAGLVHMVGQGGQEPFSRATEAEIDRALTFGARLAAWNCQFEGARGGMYDDYETLVQMLERGDEDGTSKTSMPTGTIPRVDVENSVGPRSVPKQGRRSRVRELCPTFSHERVAHQV